MATSDTEMIAFSRVFRGYDPAEVDAYLVQVTQYAQQLADRAIAAERLLEQQGAEISATRRRLDAAAGSEIPARLAQILALAEEEAQDVREHARAQERAITDQAFRNAETMVREASEQRLATERQVQRLQATRQAMISDLRDLSDQIARAAAQHESAIEIPELASREVLEEPVPVFDAEAPITELGDEAFQPDATAPEDARSQEARSQEARSQEARSQEVGVATD